MLREIGWSEWDPMRLLETGEAWAHQPFADEYDHYLLEVAAKLRRDGSMAAAISYLLEIEREGMGLREQSDAYSRAKSTAEAIQAWLIASR